VRSNYSRLLAANAAVRGRAFNFASHGATVRDLPSQVRKATILKTKPELVLVQFMANDAPCDGKDETRYADYQARVTQELQALAAGLPKARILAVSEWGTLDSYAKAVASYGLSARLTHAAKGICSIFAPMTGKVVPEHVAYIRRTINGLQRRVRSRVQGRADVPLRRRRSQTDRAEAGRPGTSLRESLDPGTREARGRRMEGAVRKVNCRRPSERGSSAANPRRRVRRGSQRSRRSRPAGRARAA
jgi:hypothetical protein